MFPVIRKPTPEEQLAPVKGFPRKREWCWTHNLIFVTFFTFLTSIVVERGFMPLDNNPYLGPSSDTMLLFGALQGKLVQQGEWWRLLWPCYMHMGFVHFFVNATACYVLGGYLEPDFGFFRVCLIFNISALTGNLFSATMDPTAISLGASGGILGFLGAGVPYTIEYWDLIHRPRLLMYSVIFMLIFTIVTGLLPGVDNYAHFGGAASGILVGFMTLSRNGYKMHYEKLFRSRRNQKSRTLPTSTDAWKGCEMSTGESSLELQWKPKCGSALLSYPSSDSLKFPADQFEEEPREAYSCGYENTGEESTHASVRFTNFDSTMQEEAKYSSKAPSIFKSFQKLDESIEKKYSGRIPPQPKRLDDDDPSHDSTLWMIRMLGGLIQCFLLTTLFYLLFLCENCYTPPGHFIVGQGFQLLNQVGE